MSSPTSGGFNYDIEADPEGTALYAQQVGDYATGSQADRTTWLASLEQAVQGVGKWAEQWKTQMGTINGSGTLASAHAAGQRVYGSGYGGWEDHSAAAHHQAQGFPNQDGAGAVPLNGIEPETMI